MDKVLNYFGFADRPYAFMLNSFVDVMTPWLRSADVPPTGDEYRVCPLVLLTAQLRVIKFRAGLLLAFGRHDFMRKAYSPTVHWHAAVSRCAAGHFSASFRPYVATRGSLASWLHSYTPQSCNTTILEAIIPFRYSCIPCEAHGKIVRQDDTVRRQSGTTRRRRP